MAEFQLIKLHAKFVVETNLLVEMFETSANEDRCKKIHSSGREGCVIRLNDCWSRFCRELIIQSASCRPITMSGKKLPLAPMINKRNEVIPKIKNLNKSKYEPLWHHAAVTIKVAQDIKIPNFADVSAGLGLTPSPLEDLNKIRNFLAHRHPDTAQKVEQVAKSLGQPPNIPVDDLLRVISTPGISLFFKWVSELQLMSELAVQ
jgi:hypothetical protein